jgi:hypothetical protein
MQGGPTFPLSHGERGPSEARRVKGHGFTRVCNPSPGSRCARSTLSLWERETRNHQRPYSLRPRVGRRPPRLRGDKLSAPRNIEGMARQAASLRRRAALSDVPFRPASGSKLRPLLGGRGLRASGKPRGPPSTSSSQGILVSPGGAPAPPGRGRSVRLPRAGAASNPANITLHESALGGPDATMIRPPRRAGISSHNIVIIVLEATMHIDECY